MSRHLLNLLTAGGSRSVATGLLVTLAFAVLARTLRGVNTSGALAGAAVCFLLYASAGARAFIVLVAVFVLTWAATRIGYRRKQVLGTAERREGRSASQILANLSVATVCAVLYRTYSAAGPRRALFLLAMASALGEAAADTVSSELGQTLSAKARLITSWEVVPAGMDGGVSLAGTLAGLAAATVISAVCAVTGLLTLPQGALAVLAAMIGVVADSFLGAGLERRGMLTNDTVNLLGTLTAAGVAWLLGK